MKYLLLLSSAVAGILSSGMAFAQKTPLTAEKMWEIKRLSAPAISPDGQYSVVTVATNDRKKDRPSSQLWLFNHNTGQSYSLTSADLNSSNPKWSPNGQFILFESKRGDDESGQLFVISVNGGEARRVTSVPTGAGGAQWFADSQRIAFTSKVWSELTTWDAQAARLKERKENKVSAKTWNQAPIRSWDTWLDDRQTHLYQISIQGGEPTPITISSGITRFNGDYSISPDGNEVALTADTDTTGVESNLDIYVLPISGGKARNITEANLAADSSPSYSPDGQWLAYSSQNIPGFYAARDRLALWNRKSNSQQIITEAFDRSVSSPQWQKDARAVVLSVDDAGTNRLYKIDIPTGKTTAITQDTSYSSPRLSDDGKTLIALNESFTQPPTLVKVHPTTGQTTVLSHFNDELLASINFGHYESVTYSGADGEPIQMWVNYPPNFDKNKKYPLFLLIHGGPHSGITNGFTWRWHAQLFAGWGYVTAWHNFHGSSGFGEKFTDSINPDWASKPYIDTMKAAEWFKSQPWIDSNKLAAGGGSYGGYLSSLILGRDHPFKTLVAHAAVYNLYTQYGADYGAGRRRHGEFWQEPELFKMISPHYQAGNFKTPTLVIHGGLDYRVPDNHGIELFNTLQNKGIKSRFVYFPDENHWILKQNNSIYWYSEVQNWLSDYLDGSRASNYSETKK